MKKPVSLPRKVGRQDKELLHPMGPGVEISQNNRMITADKQPRKLLRPDEKYESD